MLVDYCAIPIDYQSQNFAAVIQKSEPNGIDEQVLVTGDACNDTYQFDIGIGPGTYSSDLESGQEVLEQIIEFKEHYPEVKLVFGHDLETR